MTTQKNEPVNYLRDTRPEPRYKKVMVIDDNEIDLFINETILRSVAFAEEISKENDAEEALGFLGSVAQLSDVPDIIILDLNMPRMSGFEFLGAFAKLPEMVKSKCKIIVVTSSGNEEDKQRALRSPYVLRFIKKPLDVFVLKEFIFLN